MRISDWSSDVCSSDLFINNVAGDPRGCVDDQRLGLDRPVEQARDLRRRGGHRALDLARLALDEIGAFKVALDLAVDVTVDVGGHIAGAGAVRPQDRKGSLRRAGRSEARRGGKGWVGTGRAGGW